jgi:hypothetical protein
MTEGFRKDSNNGLLFISSVGQHNPVKSQTISNWIKKVLKDAGIDVEIFSSHSTRGAEASKAVAVGASLDSVLSAGHWVWSSSFKKFYHREKNPGPSVAMSVLIPDHNWYPYYSVPIFVSFPQTGQLEFRGHFNSEFWLWFHVSFKVTVKIDVIDRYTILDCPSWRQGNIDCMSEYNTILTVLTMYSQLFKGREKKLSLRFLSKSNLISPKSIFSPSFTKFFSISWFLTFLMMCV